MEITEKFTQQYEVKKSIIGASIQFINRKQSINESIESYAKTLNNLAAECKYSACCRDRLLRDTFVAGIRCSKILSSLLQDCEKKTFNEVVEKSKLLEQIRIDAEDIKSDPRGNNTTYKIKNESVKLGPNYVCIRCTTRGKHLASECFALKLTCNSCKKEGHISRACKSKKVHNVNDDRMSQTTERHEYESIDGDIISNVRQRFNGSAMQRHAASRGSAAHQGRASNAAPRISTAHQAPDISEFCDDLSCECQCEHKRIFRINDTSIPINNDPFTLKLCINDYIANFELDTGSFVSTIRRVDVIKAGGTIIPTAEKAMAYGGARINFLW